MPAAELLESAALRTELPTLATAFDAGAAQEYLEQILLEPDSRYRIESFELERATYMPGECCTLVYAAEIEDRTEGRKWHSLLTGRLMASEGACLDYLRDRLLPQIPLLHGRDEAVPFAKPAAVVLPLRMAVSVFPMDGELPTLIEATDSRRMATILSHAHPLHRGSSFENCRVELVSYGRWRRATLRYLMDGASDVAVPTLDDTVYGKLTADSRGALAAPFSATLRERATSGSYRFHVPEAFAWIPGLQLSLLRPIPGTQLLQRSLRAHARGRAAPPGVPSPEEMVAACAQIAAAIHTSAFALGPLRTLREELSWLSRWIGHVQRISPELGLRLAGWLGQLSVWADRQALELGPCHGDFTSEQVVFDGQECGLLDFDAACQGEPALDIGQFLAYLQVGGMDSNLARTGELADQIGGQFLRTYAAISGNRMDPGRLADRVEIYKAVSLLRRVIRSWQKFKPKRIRTALRALEKQMDRFPRAQRAG